MLHDHVRLEEDRIFHSIERALSEIELKLGRFPTHSTTWREVIRNEFSSLRPSR